MVGALSPRAFFFFFNEAIYYEIIKKKKKKVSFNFDNRMTFSSRCIFLGIFAGIFFLFFFFFLFVKEFALSPQIKFFSIGVKYIAMKSDI